MVVAWVCIAFVVLTIVAMLLYPGGSVSSPNSQGYSFFFNFFSDLGQTHIGYSSAGTPNTPSMVLFCIALTALGLGLARFFVTFGTLFQRSPAAIWCSRIASLCSIVAGLSYIGVAFTPWNIFLQAHNVFVSWAFRAFLAAIVFSIAAILLEPGFPRRFAVIFGGFAVVLVLYVLLLAFGPSTGTPEGSVVQATGQKIITYASILTIFIQALAARNLYLKRVPA